MAASQAVEQFDLIVVGGGPGGSTVSTLVAQQGRRVLVLERERFPRHRIGESLLPATIHGICPILGVLEEVESAGFTRKRGGTFLWGKSKTPWTFDFSVNPNSRMGYAYQVERSKFDDILLRNAQRAGVEVRQECTVDELVMEGDAVVGVRYRDAEGVAREVRAPFVADAAGHQSKFYSHVGDRHFSKFFQNVAVYGYFRNGKRLPAPNSGNIYCAAFDDGWFWYIPLSPELTSVGAVISRAAYDRMTGTREETFRHFLDACPTMRDMLEGSTQETGEMYGDFRIRKDYSYLNTRFYRKGLVLIGDSACFIDPVFSSGVHLATYSGLLAARSINTCLSGDLDAETCFAEYERRYRREYGNFYRFLISFYDMHRDTQSYFWEARKILHSEESANDAFVRLVAGRSDLADPAFSAQQFLGGGEKLGEWFQSQSTAGAAHNERMLDAINSADGTAQAANESEQFMEELLQEVVQLQMQGQLGSDRPVENERPIVAGGLVPSADGLHWRIMEEEMA